MRRATILRIMGFALLFGGPFLSRYLDEDSEMQRYFKIWALMCVPIGFTMIMISFYVAD